MQDAPARVAAQSSSQSTTPAQPPASQPNTASSPQSSPAGPVSPSPQSAQQAIFTGPVIVIDPAHGGTDSGARGQNGVIEKDLVLQFARSARIELIRQGYRTILTRDDDSNPSYDDRAAIANSYRDAIFISLHISSTGAAGTARAFFYQFATPFSAQSRKVAPVSGEPVEGVSSLPAPPPRPPSIATSLALWNEAQRPYADVSHRLADQLQEQLAQTFSGSPSASTGTAVRGLRSVTAPAVAIEISSVSAGNTTSIATVSAPLASAIVKGLEAFRPASSPGAK